MVPCLLFTNYTGAVFAKNVDEMDFQVFSYKKWTLVNCEYVNSQMSTATFVNLVTICICILLHLNVMNCSNNSFVKLNCINLADYL